MAIIGLQTSKTSNNLKVVYLILLIPASLFLCMLLFFVVIKNGDPELASHLNPEHSVFYYAVMSLLGAMPILLLWLIIGVNFQKQIIFSFTGSKNLERKTCPDIYNIVENLAISRGIPVPKIGIIEDDSMNAFATGWSPKNSYIVFSRGLLKNLTKSEIEAVAAHEMSHIINRDVRVMVIVNVFTGIIGTIGYVLLRTASSSSGGSSKNSKGLGALLILGGILYLLSLIILPFINLAISRKKEFLADAGSVELTKNKDAMINALKKISQDSRIEAIDSKGASIAAMFISNPGKKQSFFSKISSTHPPIEDRINMLNKY